MPYGKYIMRASEFMENVSSFGLSPLTVGGIANGTTSIKFSHPTYEITDQGRRLAAHARAMQSNFDSGNLIRIEGQTEEEIYEELMGRL